MRRQRRTCRLISIFFLDFGRFDFPATSGNQCTAICLWILKQLTSTFLGVWRSRGTRIFQNHSLLRNHNNLCRLDLKVRHLCLRRRTFLSHYLDFAAYEGYVCRRLVWCRIHNFSFYDWRIVLRGRHLRIATEKQCCRMIISLGFCSVQKSLSIQNFTSLLPRTRWIKLLSLEFEPQWSRRRPHSAHNVVKSLVLHWYAHDAQEYIILRDTSQFARTTFVNACYKYSASRVGHESDPKLCLFHFDFVCHDSTVLRFTRVTCIHCRHRCITVNFLQKCWFVEFTWFVFHQRTNLSRDYVLAESGTLDAVVHDDTSAPQIVDLDFHLSTDAVGQHTLHLHFEVTDKCFSCCTGLRHSRRKYKGKRYITTASLWIDLCCTRMHPFSREENADWTTLHF